MRSYQEVESSEKTEYSFLRQRDLKESKIKCNLVALVLLNSLLLSINMVVESYLHFQVSYRGTQALRETISLLLIGSEIYFFSWFHYYKQRTLPPLSQYCSNYMVCSLITFHLLMIWNFQWSNYLYVLWIFIAIVWGILQAEKQQNGQKQILALFILTLCSIIVVGLHLCSFVNFSSSILGVFFSLIVAFINCIFYKLFRLQCQNKYRQKRNNAQFLLQKALFVAFTLYFLGYDILIISEFLLQQPINEIYCIYLIVSATLFLASVFFMEEMIILLCQSPNKFYRFSQIIFKEVWELDAKQQKKQDWDVQECVLCHSELANIWIKHNCKHLTFCKACFNKVAQRQQVQFHCPICKEKPQTNRVYLLEMEEIKKGYDMKFHLKSKLRPNQYYLSLPAA